MIDVQAYVLYIYIYIFAEFLDF